MEFLLAQVYGQHLGFLKSCTDASQYMSPGGERKDGTSYPGDSVLGTHRKPRVDVQEPILREHSSYVKVLGNSKGKRFSPTA